MEIKTWEQFGIWLGMQFPVAAVVVLVARWMIAYFDDQHAADRVRTKEQHAAVIAEKNQQIADRDRRIAELVTERDKLMVLNYPSWGKPTPGVPGRQP